MSEVVNEIPKTEVKPVQNEGGAPSVDMVEKARLDSAVDDLMKYKKENADLKASQKDTDDNKLKEQNEWRQLAENRGTEIKDLKDQHNALQSTVVHSAKFNAVKDALVKNGMRSEAFIDLDNASTFSGHSIKQMFPLYRYSSNPMSIASSILLIR